MASQQGAGLELLGSILAWAGWIVVLAAVVLAFPALLDPGAAPRGGIFLSLLGIVVGGMALAGLGHLLRAVAQLGRNVTRLGEMLRERSPPPGV